MTLNIVGTIVAVCGAYLAGSIPFGLLIGKMKGIDVRQHGSGNIGATNVTRVVGKGWGKLCFALDLLKGALPVLLVKLLFKDEYGLLPSIAALFAVAGHMFPVWIGFKGGKGVSTAAGAILALCPIPLLTALLTWVIVFLLSRYVSLASILAAALLPVYAWIWNRLNICLTASAVELGLLTLLAVLSIVKHASNIKRLLNGTENRFDKKSKTENEAEK